MENKHNDMVVNHDTIKNEDIEKWKLEEEQKKLIEFGDAGTKYIYDNYNASQLQEIRLGLEEHLDVEQYANIDITWFRMEEIRKGLKVGFDVNNYLSKGFDWLQISQINKGIESEVDISVYAKKSYDHLQMEQIRLGLEDRVDVNQYLDETYSNLVMRQIRLALLDGIDISSYVKEGFGGDVLRELRLALLHKVDIYTYVKDKFDGEQLEQIRLAKEEGQDIERFISIDFFGTQLQEIRYGVESGVNVALFATGEYYWKQMREIRLALEEHLDISKIARPFLKCEQMEQIRLGLEQGVDVTEYSKIKYSAKDMEKIRLDLVAEKEKESQEDINKALEELVKFGEETLKDTTVSDLDTTINTDLASELIKQFEKGVPYAVECGVVYISMDDMKAAIELNPPGTKKYSQEYILNILEQLGISQGINYDNIKYMLKEEIYNKEVCVAQGRTPIDGIDGKYEFFVRTDLPGTPRILEDGSVDYFNMDLIESVKNTQKIAKYHKATNGKYGFTVKGILLSPKKGKDLLPLRGKGFIMSEDRTEYFAAIDGKVILTDDNRLEISRLLTIKGDIDVSTGNIKFDGDVYIVGDVLSGFRVEAGGNIQVGGHIENAVLIAGNDIIAKGGMNGGNEGIITAGRDLYGNFFEGCKIIVKGNIKANYLMNCNIYSDGYVTITGRKGLIVGGITRAFKGLEVYTLGNISNSKTLINIGVTEETMERYYKLTKNQHKINSELSVLLKGKNDYEQLGNCGNIKVQELISKIITAIDMKLLEREEVQDGISKYNEIFEMSKNSKVIVIGTAYAGVKIKFDLAEMTLGGKVTNVYFVKKNSRVAMFKSR